MSGSAKSSGKKPGGTKKTGAKTAVAKSNGAKAGGAKPDGAKTREAILDAAVQLIAMHGYDNTTLEMIARQVGLSKPGLLYHFPSKNAIIGAVLARRDQVDKEELRINQVGWKALDALVELAKVNTKRQDIVALYSAMAVSANQPSHPASSWLKGHFDEVLQTTTEAIERGKEAGEIDPCAPSDTIARTMTAIMDGIQIQWLIATNHESAPRQAAGCDKEVATTGAGDASTATTGPLATRFSATEAAGSGVISTGPSGVGLSGNEGAGKEVTGVDLGISPSAPLYPADLATDLEEYVKQLKRLYAI